MAIDVMTKPHQLIASDRVEGTAVRRPTGEMIGHIERLMIDKISEKVSYAILSFGGFLGIGTNLMPLPWGRLPYNPKFEAYELDIDEEELRRAPSFRADKDFDWGDRSQEAELHRYYGIPPSGAASDRANCVSSSRALRSRCSRLNSWNTCSIDGFSLINPELRRIHMLAKYTIAGLAGSALLATLR